MSDTVRVFVNTKMVDLPAGATVADAVGAVDPSLLDLIVQGAAFLTDGRGIGLEPTAPLESGAIIRLGVRAKARGADADA